MTLRPHPGIVPAALVTKPPTFSLTFFPKMNKVELVSSVQKTLGTSKADAERAVNAVIDGIKAGVKKSKTVQLIGFGTFKVASRKARTGVNPKTGEKIKLGPRRRSNSSLANPLRTSCRDFPPAPRKPVWLRRKTGFLIFRYLYARGRDR